MDDPDPLEDEVVGEITDRVDEVDAFDMLRTRSPLAALLANDDLVRSTAGVVFRSREGLLLEDGPAPFPTFVLICSRVEYIAHQQRKENET